MNLALLVLLTVAAILTVRVFSRIDWSRLSDGGSSSDGAKGAVDLWMPMVIVAPMVAAGGRVRGDVEAVAPLTVSLPVATAILAVGMALLGAPWGRDRSRSEIAVPPLTLAVTSVTGLVFLLLAAAGRMSVGVGQTAFAIAAVLLWLNAPDQESADEADDDGATALQSGLVLGLIALAAVKVVTMALLDTAWLPVAGGMLALEAAAVAAVIVAISGSSVCARFGAWCGVYGVLLAMGVVSLLALLRSSVGLVITGRSDETLRLASNVADGFASFALEGVLLAVLPLALLTSRALPGKAVRFVGAGLGLAGAVLAAVRLGGI